MFGWVGDFQKICWLKNSGCESRGIDLAGEEMALVNAGTDRRRAGWEWSQGDGDFTLKFAIDVAAEGFAIVSSGDCIPAIEWMKMCDVADHGDPVLFSTVINIDANSVKTPLPVKN